jgi:hypothetical protein
MFLKIPAPAPLHLFPASPPPGGGCIARATRARRLLEINGEEGPALFGLPLGSRPPSKITPLIEDERG